MLLTPRLLRQLSKHCAAARVGSPDVLCGPPPNGGARSGAEM